MYKVLMSHQKLMLLGRVSRGRAEGAGGCLGAAKCTACSTAADVSARVWDPTRRGCLYLHNVVSIEIAVGLYVHGA